MSQTTKQTKNLIAGMPDGDAKFRLIRHLADRKELTDEDLAEVFVQSVRNNPVFYAGKISDDPLLSYMWERFEAFPAALARALSAARPELFYGNQEWVTRLVIRLQSDMKMKAELGIVAIAPRRGPGGIPLKVSVDPSLLDKIPADIFRLDVDCRVRDLIYWFSRDIAMGHEYAREQIFGARNEYESRVWTTAHERIASLLALTYEGTVERMNGRMFPALHVRWWLEQSKGAPRVLNIGDTGTYKTSYAALAVRAAGCRRTLVLCAPNAKVNWNDELDAYFPWAKRPGRIHVILTAKDAAFIPANAEFVVVGYALLGKQSVLDALKDVPFDAVIWDESHYGKNVVGNDPAKRAVATMEIIAAHADRLKNVTALTATPWENSPAEAAALACVLRPDAFPDPEQFKRSGAFASPRFLRALLDTCVLDIELDEVRELPAIDPRPWEDLFGAVPVVAGPAQRRLYQHMIDHEPAETGDDLVQASNGVDASRKVRHLLSGADIPHALERVTDYDWPADILRSFGDWRLSAKLVALREYIDRRLTTGKFVVASGLNAQGVTRPFESAEEVLWLGRVLKEWYGDDSVLLLDGTVQIANGNRSALIHRWRTDPSARILVISAQTCPDSINLSVTIRHDPTVERLHILNFSLGWKPWKQMLGRFFREGQSVPISYRTFVMPGTADEARLELVRRKWDTMVRFRARVPPDDEEWKELQRPEGERLRALIRTPGEQVLRIANDMRGRGEGPAASYLSDRNGLTTNADVFARCFAEIQANGTSASHWIATHMRDTVQRGLVPGGIVAGADGIADIMCGPGTLARYLGIPVHGVDLNPAMIRVATELAPALAANLRVGRASALPPEWTGAFRLTTCSLGLDWTSGELDGQTTERLRVLNELVRVTDPHGILWITLNRWSLSDAHFAAWANGFEAGGFSVLPLSGRVTPRGEGAKEHPSFAFWSFVLSPNGKKIALRDHRPFRFQFETGSTRMVRGGRRGEGEPGKPVAAPSYDAFEVTNPIAMKPSAITDVDAIRGTLIAEFGRRKAQGSSPIRVGSQIIDEIFGSDWRLLRELERRGLIAISG